jgi:hypothetical protein
MLAFHRFIHGVSIYFDASCKYRVHLRNISLPNSEGCPLNDFFSLLVVVP